ncbi:MAG TPA: hypothetical protein VNY27_12455 [Solirubrobacteraceae bacterium]|jgi:hypothetical protein|nr:hypothetical protein [Solirubrobacteraceae bacterium]
MRIDDGRGKGEARRRRGRVFQQERALFALLVAYPRAWTAAELVREMSPPTLYVDAIAALHDAGLIHWQGGYVVPTLAATRANELAG